MPATFSVLEIQLSPFLLATFSKKYLQKTEQDTHQIIVIGVAAIVPNNAFADSLMEDISQFVEENTEAEIIDEEREIL